MVTAWAHPEYAKSKVDWAGKTLVASQPDVGEYDEALGVIDNWRTSHSFPLNAFQIFLRRLAPQVDKNALTAQRIKRLSSIESKLRRFKTMKLSQIQDIGGCRAVVHSVSSVERLVERFTSSRTKLRRDDIDDYIASPKASGYRGVHLIYRYNSDRSPAWNGLQIEIQIRSPLQHAWATAVETVGTFTRQALKSSQGEEDWLRFFALMGTSLAHREKTAPVPGTPEIRADLVREIRELNKSLKVVPRLHAYGRALQTLDTGVRKSAHYYLLVLDAENQRVQVRGFARSDLEKASQAYLAEERDFYVNPGRDAVLVSVESIAALRRAYPNYFLDTAAFTSAVRKTLKG